MRRFSVVACAAGIGFVTLLATPGTDLLAQDRFTSIVSQDNGHAALGLAIRRLDVNGTLIQAVAHPDDEHNGLFAKLTLGQGLRSVDVHLTRGAGGQNEIGPELFQDIAVLRTSELMAAHRLDGAEQWFTRAIDFGYTFSAQEVLDVWNRREVVRDVVRFIRTFRPDVVVTMNLQGAGGDRAHEANAIVVRDAFRAAGDPTQFPEQISEGLRPWQARKLYLAGAPGSGVIGGPASVTGRAGATSVTPSPAVPLATIVTDVFDPLLGRTYNEIGVEARTNHKCQGMGQLGPLPGGVGATRGRGPSQYTLIDTTIPGQKDKNETSLFDGIDTSLTGLAQFAGPNPPEALTTGLAAISAEARRAKVAFETVGDAATAEPITAGLAALRTLRAQLGSMGLSDTARFEIETRLKVKERDYETAAVAAYGVSFEVLADDGLVVAGQPVKVTIIAANRGAASIDVAGVGVSGFGGTASCPTGPVKQGAVYVCTPDLTIPSETRLTDRHWTDEYWNRANPKDALDIPDPDVPFGAPFRPTPFRVAFRLKAGGVEIVRDVPVQYRYVKDLLIGERRMELNVVPAYSVKVTPTTTVVPGGGVKATVREVHVAVTTGAKAGGQANVTLDVPAGWTVTPASAPVTFRGEDESLTVRFNVTVPAAAKLGDYQLSAAVTSAATGATKFASGYYEIDYPHIQHRQVIKPATAAVKIMNVKVTPGVRLGYVVGAGDQIPPALEQLGAKVSFIDADELALGDLSKYDVIMTGVRAYEQRPDLRANNRRLLDFAERGGVVIVQYNKMGFNAAQYGPFPARVGSGRVTDEGAAVKVLVPTHPVFNVPNKIGEATWKGWVQERGLYFLGEKDPKYVDLISMEDTAPDNAGVKLGSLVEAKVGKGRWIYVGLALWRQAPASVEGGYQLLSNLISLGRRPGARGL